QNLPRNVIFDGPDQSGLSSSRLKDGFDEKCSRAFSVGARNSGIRNSLRRTFVEICAQAGKRAASMHNLRPGNRGPRHFGSRVGNNSNCPRGNRLIDEAIPVASLPLHRDKNRSWPHPPRIVLHPANARVSALREELGALQELLEGHWSDYK